MKTEQSKRIFISRSLKPDSPFHELTSLGHKLTATSLIKISYQNFEKPTEFDAVFFYSQKAIRHFLESCPYSNAVQYGVMGKSSAAIFQDVTDFPAEIVGKGNTKELAQSINQKWKDKKVIFPQAQKSMRSLEALLPNVTVDNLVVYANDIDEEKQLGDFDILAFTSPLNVKAFLSKQTITSQNVFAIGGTTAAAVQGLAGIEVAYCGEPSEKALCELVSEHI